jgi:glutaredoxin 3
VPDEKRREPPKELTGVALRAALRHACRGVRDRAGRPDASTEIEEVIVADIEVYSTEWCPYCVMAKKLLASKGLDYREIDVTYDDALRREMEERSGRRTAPEIFIDDEFVGGYDELARLNATGELDRRLGLG